jgi:hypothetical protein
MVLKALVVFLPPSVLDIFLLPVLMFVVRPLAPRTYMCQYGEHKVISTLVLPTLIRALITRTMIGMVASTSDCMTAVDALLNAL